MERNAAPGVVARQPPREIHQDHVVQVDSSFEGITKRSPLAQQAKLEQVGVKPAQASEIHHTDHVAQQPQHSASQLTRSPKKQADTCLQPLHALEGWSNKSQHCVEVQTQIGELLAGHQI